MNPTEPIVTIRDLSKRFRQVTALNSVDLDIHPGRIIGLLGANGCGKSTLLRHIIGLYLPDSGQCTTFSCLAEKLGPPELARIGYVHQEGELLDWMTVKQLIQYVSAYYPHWNTALEENYVHDFEIPLKARVGTLSPGVRQKLAILLAIGFDPELLILDEPASGLDPIARAKFLDLLLAIIQDSNRTIIISSHILADVEKAIDHVIIMQEGRLLTDCSLDDLREKFVRVKLTSVREELPAELPFGHVLEAQRTTNEAILTISSASPDDLQEKAALLACNIEIQPLTLEDIYRIVVTQESQTEAQGAAG